MCMSSSCELHAVQIQSKWKESVLLIEFQQYGLYTLKKLLVALQWCWLAARLYDFWWVMLLLRVACTHKHGAKCHKLLQMNSLGHKQRIYDFASMPEHIQGHWMLKHVAMKTEPLYIRFPVAIICHQHHVANRVPGVCLCKETQKTGTGCFQYLSEKVQKKFERLLQVYIKVPHYIKTYPFNTTLQDVDFNCCETVCINRCG